MQRRNKVPTQPKPRPQAAHWFELRYYLGEARKVEGFNVWADACNRRNELDSLNIENVLIDTRKAVPV